MYAVIRAGGKQQKVKPGDIIEVELTHADGDTVTFHPLLVVDDEGTTHVGKDAERATVTATPMGEKKGEKVHIFKYKNKSGYSRRKGHRQQYTLLEIGEITLGAAKRSSMKEEAAEEPAEASAE